MWSGRRFWLSSTTAASAASTTTADRADPGPVAGPVRCGLGRRGLGPTLCGYRPTAPQYEDGTDEPALHAVRVRPGGDGAGGSALVPLLLDESAPYRLTEGVPDTTG